MANKSRDKGHREEREVVNNHREIGIPAQRTLESGARNDGTITYDLDVYYRGNDHAPIIGECKIRASGFKKIYQWLGDNDFLTLRADRKERLYVMKEETWLHFLWLISNK